jgi:hypothetical protein
MIWAIVYGGLAAATVAVVAVPAVRIAKQAKGLAKILAASGARIDEALVDIERARGDRSSRRRPARVILRSSTGPRRWRMGTTGTYHPGGPDNSPGP